VGCCNQKHLRNWAILLTFLLGALAHLGLARAYALQGDTAKARGATSSNSHRPLATGALVLKGSIEFIFLADTG